MFEIVFKVSTNEHFESLFRIPLTLSQCGNQLEQLLNVRMQHLFEHGVFGWKIVIHPGLRSLTGLTNLDDIRVRKSFLRKKPSRTDQYVILDAIKLIRLCAGHEKKFLSDIRETIGRHCILSHSEIDACRGGSIDKTGRPGKHCAPSLQ